MAEPTNNNDNNKNKNIKTFFLFNKNMFIANKMFVYDELKLINFI